MNQPHPDTARHDSGRPLRVGLIFGGTSSEHGVSCLGAAAVAQAIDSTKYELVGVGITRRGRWQRVGSDDLRGLQIRDSVLPELPEGRGPEVVLRGTGQGPVLWTEAGEEPLDVAFLMLHGPGGEDGAIQGFCESIGLRYTGSGVAASAVGMDKHLMKLLFDSAGIPIGPYVAITPDRWGADPEECLRQVSGLEFPVFVKPARAGSSQGITRVSEPAGLRAAIEVAREHDPKVVVEQGFVGAREIECGVFDSDTGPQVSVLGEVVMHGKDGFYDYESKYTPGDEVSIVVPTRVDAGVEERIRGLAAEVFAVLGCEGHARVDCFLTADDQVMINEINTLPGFTATSMFPQVWQASGIDFTAQITRLLECAMSRSVGLR